MKLILFILLALSAWASGYNLDERIDTRIVLSSRRIVLPNYPDAFNPSILEYKDGYLLVFRYCSNRYWDPWHNHIGIVRLNSDLEPISEPQLLSTGLTTPCVKSQAEDARIFALQGRLYLIYNDNVEVSRPWYRDRRDMYLAELVSNKDGSFSLLKPTKLIHEQRYSSVLWQKNWTPFEWYGKLFLAYSISPHEILYPNLEDGSCYSCYETNPPLHWELGLLRGSSPALMVDGAYLSFFHSGHQLPTNVSGSQPLWHYFMGAYTFSAEPPFELTKISPGPLIGEGFYTQSYHDKKVILPGGFVIKGSRIYVAYGRNDDEMWIAELDKDALMQSLIPVNS